MEGKHLGMFRLKVILVKRNLHTMEKLLLCVKKDGKEYYKTNGKKPKRTLFNAFSVKKEQLKKQAEAKLKKHLDL